MKQMMKKYLYMAAVAVVGTGFLMSSCKDEFAGQNTNPSTVSKPNVRYLFTQCAMSFQPADYLQWFAGFDAMSTLCAGNCLRRWKLQQIEYGNSDRLWLSGQRGASLYE